MKDGDTLIHYGAPVKALETNGDRVTVGGHLVVFDDPEEPVKDLAGDFFTQDTYYGARKGDGAECLFHHGIPLKAELAHLSRQFFEPIKVEEDDVGLFASTALDLRKDYEASVYELVEQKALGWSSGAITHLVEREPGGWLKTWIIGEGSLTPTPCEPRTSCLSLKALQGGVSEAFASSSKAENLTARMRAVQDAFYQLIDREAPGDWDSYVAEVWDEYAIVRVESIIGAGWYRAGYTYSAGDREAELASAGDWERVEPTDAQATTWEALKSLYFKTVGLKGEALGAMLRNLRDEQNLTNQELADAAGVSASTMQQILSGEIIRPPNERLEGLSDLLGVSMSDLEDLADADSGEKSYDTERSFGLSALKGASSAEISVTLLARKNLNTRLRTYNW